MQQICDEEANDDSNYPGLKEYGLDYALTVTRADGSTENYGSNNIKNYVKETYGKDQGLLYSSEDAARAMVEEWKATIAREEILMMNVSRSLRSHSLLSRSWIRRPDRSKQWSADVEKSFQPWS